MNNKLNEEQMEYIASKGWLARYRYNRAIKLRAKRQKLVRKIAKLENSIIKNDEKIGLKAKPTKQAKKIKEFDLDFEQI